jgi:hypothetical protein
MANYRRNFDCSQLTLDVSRPPSSDRAGIRRAYRVNHPRDQAFSGISDCQERLSVQCDCLHRLAANARDRHPDGDWRRACGGAADGASDGFEFIQELLE